MKDASTCVAIVTKDGSTLTSGVITGRPEKKDASTFVKIRKKNVATSTSVESETEVESEDEGQDEARCKPIRFGATVFPYDKPLDMKQFDTDMANPELSSDMVGFLMADKFMFIRLQIVKLCPTVISFYDLDAML